jgi:hypothetical protein
VTHEQIFVRYKKVHAFGNDVSSSTVERVGLSKQEHHYCTVTQYKFTSTDSLLSFHMTRSEYKATRPTILMLLRVFCSNGNVFTEPYMGDTHTDPQPARRFQKPVFILKKYRL